MGKVLEGRSSKEELVWTDHNPPIPHPLHSSQGEEVEEL